MNKTTTYVIDLEKRICVTSDELCALLGCGKKSALEIANRAEARIYIGKRVLFSVDKIKTYILNESF